jgi:hypothetical protein
MYISIIIATVLLIITPTTAFATGLRGDPGDDATDERADCFINGYDSGFAGKYDSDRAKECIEHKDQYNQMWDTGCEDSLRTETECAELINNPVQIEDYEPFYGQNLAFCYRAATEDGRNGTFNEEREDGCYEFGDYEQQFQVVCKTHTTPSECELKYEDKKFYCPKNPDVGGCTGFLHNATNKQLLLPICAENPGISSSCPQGSNDEKYF